MPVKSKVKNEVGEKFPLLVKNGFSGLILLVSKLDMNKSYYKGVVVGSNDVYEIGHYSDCWFVDDFTPFEGEVTLSNT